MTREVTRKLIEMMDEGVLSPRVLAETAIGYMSEDDVAEMARINDILIDHPDDFDGGVAGDQYDYEHEVDEAQEWHDFDPDC